MEREPHYAVRGKESYQTSPVGGITSYRRQLGLEKSSDRAMGLGFRYARRTNHPYGGAHE